MADQGVNDDPVQLDDGSLSALIRQSQAGCGKSQNELFRQLQAYLAYVADTNVEAPLRRKLSPSDVVQQSFVRAVEQLPDYRGNTSLEFKGWLRQILINEIRQGRRVLAADKRDVRREMPLGGEASDQQPRELIDRYSTPAALALADEQAAAVRRILQRLPENYQTVIRLRNWEELSFEVIGARMNLSTSGAAKVWYRALVAVRQLYQQEHESRNR